MNAQTILGIDQRHTIVAPQDVVFNVVPHLAEARKRADFYGESIAIYRYVDNRPDDVFYTFAEDMGDKMRKPYADRIVVEAVVNPNPAA
jgi:hypothetical protein